jgi:hypothetical protein
MSVLKNRPFILYNKGHYFFTRNVMQNNFGLIYVLILFFLLWENFYRAGCTRTRTLSQKQGTFPKV